VRILLIEDDAGLAARVVRQLQRSGEFEVRHVASCAAAFDTLSTGVFDVGLVDLGLGDGSGLDVIARLAGSTPPVPSIAFTVFDDRKTVLDAIDAGACGYILKDDGPDRLAEALRAAAAGDSPLSYRAASHVVGRSRHRTEDVELTPREVEVLAMIAKGMTYEECADLLEITLGTVQSHVKNLYRKLDVQTKAEAAVWAARHNLV
jgi:DNA-binding NarL/FixJ family response regulator